MTSPRLPRRLIALRATGQRAICSPMDEVALLAIAFGAVTALFAADWVLVVERRPVIRRARQRVALGDHITERRRAGS